MSVSIKWRLSGLILAMSVLALLIGFAARTSWREIRLLQERFSRGHVITFEVADRFQSAVLQLNHHLWRFEISGDPAQREEFRKQTRNLEKWMREKKPVLTSEEQEVLREVDEAYADYLADSRKILESNGRSAPGQSFAGANKVMTDSLKLLNLGTKLATAHRHALEQLLVASQVSVVRLQRLIFGSLVALMVLGFWLARTVYGEMIAPLRVKLVESQALLERHEKLASLGMLAAGVAHEIRNPLTAIKARLFTQQKVLRPDSPEMADAEFIGQEIDRLERIVRDFLLFARPSDPQFQIVPAEGPLREVQALMTPSLEKSRIRLVLEKSPTVRIKADAGQIKQILINLVQNAADSMGGSGVITLRARLDPRRLDSRMRPMVVLEVADTGKGIPPEVEKRLFDPFFTTKENGTGLGLSIAARMVEKNGGALQYQTQVNRGTTFGIVLPQAE